MKALLATAAALAFVSSATAGTLDQPHGRTMSARTLVEAYAKNPIAADNLYKGKVYTLSGRVEKIASEEKVYVDLEVEGVPIDRGVWWLRCYFASTDGLAALQAGKTISVTGAIDGLRNNKVMLRDCYLPR